MSNPELAFIPWEGMGHLVPMVELAKLMLQRNQSLSISILVMRTSMDFGADKYLDSVTSDSGHLRLRFLDLRQYNDPDAGEVELNPDNFLFDFIDKQTANVRRFAQTNYADECDRPRLVGFVIDMFCVPMIDVANEFGVPTYLFFASGIGFLGLSLHFQALKHDHEEDTSRYKNSDEELSIPCYANPVPAKALPAPMVEKNPGTDMFFDGVKRYKETKGIMVNTFADLEHYALQMRSGGGGAGSELAEAAAQEVNLQRQRMKQRAEVHQREESKERGEEEENNKGKMVLTKELFFPSEPENKILGCSSDFIFLKNEELKFQRKTNSGEPNKGKEQFRNSLPVEVHFLPTSCEPNMA